MSVENQHFLGQTLHDCGEKTSLSRWWIAVLGLVMIYGFTILITITCKAYLDKPPIPGIVVSSNGEKLFTAEDVRKGQEAFLDYGLILGQIFLPLHYTRWGWRQQINLPWPILIHRLTNWMKKSRKVY